MPCNPGGHSAALKASVSIGPGRIKAEGGSVLPGESVFKRISPMGDDIATGGAECTRGRTEGGCARLRWRDGKKKDEHAAEKKGETKRLKKTQKKKRKKREPRAAEAEGEGRLKRGREEKRREEE